MTLIRGERRGKGFWKGKKGNVMGFGIFAGKWGIGPGNVLVIRKEEVREVRALVRTSRVQANSGLVREVRALVRTGRGQAKADMVRVETVRALNTKVHVSTASKLDIRQQSA